MKNTDLSFMAILHPKIYGPSKIDLVYHFSVYHLLNMGEIREKSHQTGTAHLYK